MLPIRCILHPTDFSESSDSALRLACSLARDHGAEVLIVHVLEPMLTVFGDRLLPQPEEVALQEIKDKLLQMKGPDPKVPVRHRLEEGLPADQILRVAREDKCDLIVMGTHGRRGLSRLLLGSVAEQVTRQATCPVVVVKTPCPQAVLSPEVSETELARA
jgi:nucleotide-binding universal stress UspA family protein